MNEEMLTPEQMLAKFKNGGYKDEEQEEKTEEQQSSNSEVEFTFRNEEDNNTETEDDGNNENAGEETKQEDATEPKEDGGVDALIELYKALNIDKSKAEKGKFPIKHNGELKWVEPNVYASLANKGEDYTKKTQILSKYKNSIKTIEDNGITEQDLKAIELFKKGNTKDAIAMLSNGNKVSHDAIVEASMDIDDDYINAATYSVDNGASYDLMGTLNLYPENIREKISEYWVTDTIPESFKTALSSNKQLMNALAKDVDAGVADRVIPEMNRRIDMELSQLEKNIMLTDPDEIIRFYVKVAESLDSKGNTQTTSKPQRSTKSTADDLKRANHGNYGRGTTTKNKANPIQKHVVDDILSWSEEERDTYYMDKFGIKPKR